MAVGVNLCFVVGLSTFDGVGEVSIDFIDFEELLNDSHELVREDPAVPVVFVGGDFGHDHDVALTRFGHDTNVLRRSR